MGILHRSAALIGFYGDDLEPSEITARMGTEPTVGVRKGGSWMTSTGTAKTAHTGSWRLQADREEPVDLEGQIKELLDRLTNDLLAWRSFSMRYRGRVFCGLFLASGNESMTLNAVTLARIGERGLVLDLDIYGQEMLN